MRHLPAIALIALVGCVPDGPEDPPDGATPPEYESPYGDPVEVLDTYGGPSFSELNEVEYRDGLVYFCSGVLGMNVYDASDPEDLDYRSRIGFSLGSRSFPRCQHVVVDDQRRAYVTNRANSMQPQSWIGVADLTDVERPDEIGMHPIPENPEGMTIHGDLLLLAAHEAGLIVHRREGGDLVELGRAPTTNAWAVAARGDRAWVADGAGGLVTVDLADPAAPTVLHTLPLQGAAKDLALPSEQTARAHADAGLPPVLGVAMGTAGVGVVALEDPSAPTLLHAVDTPGAGTAVAWLRPPSASDRPAIALADWADVRVFEVTPKALLPVAREPLPLGPSDRRESRTMGIATHEDVIFSGNWTELVSYRWFPDRAAPDLEVSPNPVLFSSTPPGSSSSFPVRVTNGGETELTFRGVDPRIEELSVEVPEVLAPGETATATVTYDSITDAGVSTDVLLLTDDPDQPELRLHVEANMPGIGVGEPAAASVFDDIDGPAIALEDLRGSVVLLAYFATF